MEYLATGRVHIGDVRDLAARMEPQSVQTIVTSPPYYGLRSYLDAEHPSKGQELGSEATPAEFVANLVAVFAALRPALKDDGTVWLNLGDSYNGGGGYAPDAPSNADGNHRNGGRSREFSSASRKGQNGYPQKCLLGMPWRVAFALIDDGWILRSEITWAKKSPMPESVTDRPTSATEKVFLFAKRPTYFYDQTAVAEKASTGERFHGDYTGSGNRTQGDNGRERFDNTTATRNMRNFWLLGPENFPGAHFAVFPSAIPRRAILSSTSAAGECSACGKAWARLVEQTPATRTPTTPKFDAPDVGHMAGSGRGLHGPGWRKVQQATAVPTGWAPQCQCPPGTPTRPQLVLDPFMGSGTTAAVAFALGRDWIGLDLDERAIDWTNGRLAKMPVGTLC